MRELIEQIFNLAVQLGQSSLADRRREHEAHKAKMKETTSTDRFDVFLNEVQERAEYNGYKVYTTDADPQRLWEAYLDAAPEGHRQCRNCRACRRFIQKYGGLVVVNEAGAIIPFLWPVGSHSHLYEDACVAMRQIVNKASITGVFLSSERILGQAPAGEWTHLWVKNRNVWSNPIKTAEQAMAEKREEYKMADEAIRAYGLHTVRKAIKCLELSANDKKHVEQLRWFEGMHTKGPNDRWIAIANAPAGYAHIKSGMVGSLLDDLEKGCSPDRAMDRWREKMDPLQYMRPQAPAKQGTVEQANKMVEKLGIEGALKRKRARLSDIPFYTLAWLPAQSLTKDLDGFFNFKPNKGLAGKHPKTMSFTTFRRDILPQAKSIEVNVPSHGDFVAFTTAQDANAPKIFQWDHHCAWYRQAFGSDASEFSTRQGLKKCVAIIDSKDFVGNDRILKDAFFIIEGASHTRTIGLGIFPQCLKSDYHGVRSVIEQYSRTGKLERDDYSAAGIGLSGGVTVHVDLGGVTGTLLIDRYE